MSALVDRLVQQRAMGATLPEPVMSTVVERHGAEGFNVGVAEMNGWRNSMEDAHLVFTREDWGFFGVFDGHGGEACSKFVARRLREEVENKGCPKNDEEVRKLVFDVDQEFIDSQEPSGSTATMCIVCKPHNKGDKHKLHVINIGDSRVLLGRLDGTILDGGGTDKGLTTDHKPDHPNERKRIYRCGGSVEESEGNVARVNGDLAVSRGFGDHEYKTIGGPGPEDHPVTVDPEMSHFECAEADFLLLVCDGVSEGSFPNQEVVQLVAKLLREGKNPGIAAQNVCHTAVRKNSKDNITCMVVCFTSAEFEGTEVEFFPGPLTSLEHKRFKNAYTAMAKKANHTLAQAVEKRYENVQAELVELSAGSPQASALRDELAKVGTPESVSGSPERAKWFEKWAQNLPEDTGDGLSRLEIASILSSMGKAFTSVRSKL